MAGMTAEAAPYGTVSRSSRGRDRRVRL